MLIKILMSYNHLMEYKQFKELLLQANLNVKQFCQLSSVPYSTCNNWTTSSTPSWVQSWLKLYIENQKFQKLKTLAKEICDDKND